MKYRYTGSHAAVTSVLSGDGKAKLKKWRDNASFGRDQAVWLCDTDACDVRLVLTDALIDSPDHWQGEAFTAPGACLDIVVEADSPEKCYEVLRESLFCRFDGQKDTGKACFPVWAGAASVSGEEHLSRVLVRQVDPSAGKASAASDAVDLEYLTVSVQPGDAGPDKWEAVAP